MEQSPSGGLGTTGRGVIQLGIVCDFFHGMVILSSCMTRWMSKEERHEEGLIIFTFLFFTSKATGFKKKRKLLKLKKSVSNL